MCRLEGSTCLSLGKAQPQSISCDASRTGCTIASFSLDNRRNRDSGTGQRSDLTWDGPHSPPLKPQVAKFISFPNVLGQNQVKDLVVSPGPPGPVA